MCGVCGVRYNHNWEENRLFDCFNLPFCSARCCLCCACCPCCFHGKLLAHSANQPFAWVNHCLAPNVLGDLTHAICSGILRYNVRVKAGFGGDKVGDFAGDCLIGTFCAPCNLCQILREGDNGEQENWDAFAQSKPVECVQWPPEYMVKYREAVHDEDDVTAHLGATPPQDV